MSVFKACLSRFRTKEANIQTKTLHLLHDPLQDLYGDLAGVVVKQAVAKLQTSYHGDLEKYLEEFFYPAINLLVKLKKESRKHLTWCSHSSNNSPTRLSGRPSNTTNSPTSSSQVSEGQGCCCCSHCDKWPLALKSHVLVNLSEISCVKFENGDFNLFLDQSLSGQVELCVRYRTNGEVYEKCIPECDFRRILTMEWKEGLKSESSSDFREYLQNCLVHLQDSIEKLRWEDVVAYSTPYHHGSNRLMSNDLEANTNSWNNNSVNGNNVPHSQQDQYATDARLRQLNTGATELEGQESRPRTMDSTDGREAEKPRSPRSVGLHQHRHLDPPKTILDVDYRLLQSGVAILPGCRDLEDHAVVLIFTSSSLWKNQLVRSTDLARLIMYYHSVPREVVRCRGLTIIVDIRGASTSTINTLLESLYLFEGNIPQSISMVHLLSDKHTQSLVLKSPIYDVHASFQINLLLSPDILCSYIPADQLPVVLEGHFQYSHEDWIRFHMRLDPFLSSCRAVARYIANVIQELSVVDQVPASSKEANHLVNHHDNLIKAAFEDPRVLRLQNEGDEILNSLQREEVNIGHTDDFRYAMEDVTRLYKHVQETMARFMRLSDTRLERLEKCLHLKEFDEECSKIISWLHSQGNECLQRHLVMADNLKGVKSQQKEFEKFHFAAMSHIEKGNDLLEEASMLAQSGDFDEVTGYKELARMLKRHLQQFSERLEETRERIEGASKCYQLLDKTYEWALEAMKYVASMKMEHCATPEGLEKLLRSLQLYLQEHPPIPEETFVHMSEIGQKLKNEKLIEQCRTAQNRCQETQKMLTLRGNTLQQFKEQLEQESSTAEKTKSVSTIMSETDSRTNSDTSRFTPPSAAPQTKSGSSSGLKPHWEPKDTSTPIVPKTYSRTHAERLKNVSPTKSVLSSSSNSSSVSSPSHSYSSTSISPCHSATTSPAHFCNTPHGTISPVHAPVGHDQNYGANSVTEASDMGQWTKARLQGSKENVIGDNKAHVDRSVSAPQLPETNNQSSNYSSSAAHMFSSWARPAKKLLKRAISTPQTGLGPVILEEDPCASETERTRLTALREDGRTNSMITGSSDSIPSLPEEDEGVVEDQSYVRQEWTPVPVNTHLTEQAYNTPTRPPTDLTDAEIKSRRTLSLVMSEMVQTERDYVCSLRFVVENYIPEMEREDVPQALRGQRNVIFGNIEKIYQFHHQYFVQEMEASRRNPFLIARYFLMHESQFHLYTLYNKNKPKSDALMAEYGKNFFREKQLSLGDKMDLGSYLLKPVQRMGKYALLIKQVMKECPRNTQEYQDLASAEQMVRFQLRHGNDLLAMDALRDCDVNLPEQGRLLRQDEFLVYQGRRKFMRHVFLFEDLVLFSKTKRLRNGGGQDTYTYKSSFKMSDIGLTEDYDGSTYKFEMWFRRRCSRESFVLQALHSDIKKAWVKDITRLLWSQAVRNRENRLSELASMGIGNKPCLDIKPSADNINDRLINIAVGSRGARSRNSIAVCSMEHLRQGNKRPHSIISISSNSSSNSSHSAGGFGTMNLAFNPTDTRDYRKSLTFMSSESGIGTDISSSADADSALKFDPMNPTRARSPPPAYTEFAKPRLLHMESEPQMIKLQGTRSEEVTDL